MSDFARTIALRPWSPDDRAILDRTVGDARMMEHLGGPESAAAMDARHARYVALALAGDECMYAIELDATTPVGSVGYWESERNGDPIYEAGWMVFPEFARQGIASAAALLIIEKARAARGHRFLHAFPAVSNAASNGVCKKAGFVLLGPCDVEYPKGHTMRSNDWRIDLTSSPRSSSR